MPPPVRQDPFESLKVSHSSYKKLKLGLIFSNNTKNAVIYADKKCRGGAKAFGGIAPILHKAFGEVVEIGGVEEAAAINADLVAILDIYADFSTSLMENYKIEIAAKFLTPDNTEIGTVRTKSSATGYTICGGVLASVADRSVRDFEAAISGSVKLADFAKSRVPSDKTPVVAARTAPSTSRSSGNARRSDVDKPVYKLREKPHDFALIIGIENYQNLPPAEFAERDAKAMKAHLLAQGYPERNIIYLIGPKASRTGIEKYIDTWLPLNIKKDSRLFVYFSGHGAPDAATGQAYLVPWDGDAAFLKNTGYPIDRLYAKLDALDAKEVILVMDACFSGGGVRSVLAKGTRPLVTKVDIGVRTKGKLKVFAASRSNEITGSEESQGHGLFTYYFLKGLNAGKGKSTIKELYRFLLPKVQDAARRAGREQTPQLLP